MELEDGHPSLRGKIKVGAEGGTTQKPCAILADLGTTGGKLLLIDLPGLHDAPSSSQTQTQTQTLNQQGQAILPNVTSLFQLLKKTKIDLGIFVIDSVPTDSSLEDFNKLKEIAKKVILVYNKIDTLDYLKPEKRKALFENVKKKMGASEIYPTACKGFDPEADRSQPNWFDVRGIDALHDAIEEYVQEHKHEELALQMKSREFWKNVQSITLRAAIGVGFLAIFLARKSM